jgi:DNA-binding transcriptional MerR regulator
MGSMPDEPSDRKFKIGEVCRKADVAPYVLRYWETEFPALSPGKTGGGQRLYSEREVDIILRIKQLLYSEGFTIAGAKKKLDLELAAEASGEAFATPEAPAPVQKRSRSKASNGKTKVLLDVKRELTEILDMLEK